MVTGQWSPDVQLRSLAPLTPCSALLPWAAGQEHLWLVLNTEVVLKNSCLKSQVFRAVRALRSSISLGMGACARCPTLPCCGGNLWGNWRIQDETW